MINSVKTNLIHSIFSDRLEVDKRYLLSLDSRALLQNYTLEAGVILENNQITPDPSNTYLHWGWESPTCQLRGHFLGHWMSASSKIIYSEGCRELEAKLYDIVDKLAEYQKLNGDGWVGPIPQKYMYILRQTDRYIWSPQYTMHKFLMGLIDTYEFTGYEKAISIFSGLADWYLSWIKDNDVKCPEATYLGETGGMLEIWARAYLLTGDNKYLDLAHAYDHPALFDALDKGEDPLTDNHANASIPWSHGLCAMFLATGEEKYLELAKKFWKCAVNDRESYATNGQNAGEFWIPKGKLGEYISDRNQEFCTVYNMVRLADYLFRFTGDREYQDYIERCIYNGFLAQQNPHTGMPTYFLPMKSGSKKTWGSKTHDFWCCHGTMVQSPTIYQSLIFYYDEDKKTVTLGQFIPGKTQIEIDGSICTIELCSDDKGSPVDTLFEETANSKVSRWNYVLNIDCDVEKEFALKIRIPEWASDKIDITSEDLNKDETGNIKNGFLKIRKVFNKARIRFGFSAELYLMPLPDRKDLAAVLEGPIVIASVGESALLKDEPQKCLLPKTERVYQTIPWMQSHYFLPTKGSDRDFIPLYEIVDEEYSIYQRIR